MPCVITNDSIRISHLFPSGDLEFLCIWIAENSVFDLVFGFLPFFLILCYSYLGITLIESLLGGANWWLAYLFQASLRAGKVF